MAALPALRFLDLSSELRIRIYDAINMENSVPMSEFKGLYLSCRQVKEEMHYECTQKMNRRVMAAATSGGLNLGLTLDSDFERVREVVVKLDAAIFDKRGSIDHMPIFRLAMLPLETLTIAITNRSSTRSNVQRRIQRLILHCCIEISKSAQAVRVPSVKFEDEEIGRVWKAEVRLCRCREAKDWSMVMEYEIKSGGSLLRRATLAPKKEALELRVRVELDTTRLTRQSGRYSHGNGSTTAVCGSPRSELEDT